MRKWFGTVYPNRQAKPYVQLCLIQDRPQDPEALRPWQNERFEGALQNPLTN